MKNSSRIILIVLSVVFVQTLGFVAAADEPTVGVCGGPATVNPVSSSFGADGGTGGFTVPIPACFWAPTSADSWISVDEYGWFQSLAGLLNYTVAPTDQGGPRDGSISVNGNEVHTIHQAGACGIVVDFAPNSLSTPAVFVSNTACERIVEVTGGWNELYSEPGSSYEGLVYGPNETLYALDPTRGLIVDLSDPETPVHIGSLENPPVNPREAVFNHHGDLVVVDRAPGSALYVFPNQEEDIGDGVTLVNLDPPSAIPGSGGIGMLMDVTTAANGDLLVADWAGTIWRFPFNALSSIAPYGWPSKIATEIGYPSTTIARSSNGMVFVGSAGALQMYSFDTDWVATSEDVCNDFGGGTTVQDVELSADDTLYVTVTNVDGGQLWEIPYNPETGSCGSPTLPMATFTRVNPTLPLVVGVALPHTSREGKLVSDNPPGVDSQLFNFWDSVYEFSADNGCEVAITAYEYSATDIQSVIDTQFGSNSGVRGLTFFGDRGAIQVYQYQPAATEYGCDPSEPNLYGHAINAFYEIENPRFVVCHTDDPLTGLPAPTPGEENPACEVLGVSSISFNGLIVDDGRTRITEPDFSQAFMVNQPLVDGTGDAIFCGIEPPLTWPATPDDTDLMVAESGSTVPVSFKLAQAGGDCQKGPFITKEVYALLSVTRIEDPQNPQFIDYLDIVGGGTALPGEAIFQSPQNKNKPFSLQLKLTSDGSNYAEGLYEITIVALTNNFPVQRTYFKVK